MLELEVQLQSPFLLVRQLLHAMTDIRSNALLEVVSESPTMTQLPVEAAAAVVVVPALVVNLISPRFRSPPVS